MLILPVTPRPIWIFKNSSCTGSVIDVLLREIDIGKMKIRNVYYKEYWQENTQYHYLQKIHLENYMILASQKASNLYKVEVDENDVNLDGSILSGVGRIRDVAEGPDGYLYVITSNTDGKAFPSDDDDKLLRIMK